MEEINASCDGLAKDPVTIQILRSSRAEVPSEVQSAEDVQQLLDTATPELKKTTAGHDLQKRKCDTAEAKAGDLLIRCNMVNPQLPTTKGSISYTTAAKAEFIAAFLIDFCKLLT